MTLQINDLARHNHPLDLQLRAAIDRVLKRGHYVLGPENEAFEQEFATYLGTTGAVGVGNGTDALELALRALDVGPGDEVITVANAGMYASTAIRAAGAIPRYIDIESEHMLIDVECLPNCITRATRAIIVTHLYGRMADMAKISELAGRHGISVLEDCAQAHGATRNAQKAGTWGDLAAFSFYPTKNLGALGDGGLVTGRDPALLDRVRHLRQYGWSKRKYEVTLTGGRNSRLDELQASILRTKLPYLDAWNARRREIVRQYRVGLGNLHWILPSEPGDDNVAHLCVVRPRDRDRVRASLAKQGINSEVHYPIPDHLQPAFALSDQLFLPVTVAASRRILTLPCFPELRDDEVAWIIAACRQAAAEEEDSV